MKCFRGYSGHHFTGDRARLLDEYTAEDGHIGSLGGAGFAEPFKARTPLLVSDSEVFAKAGFG